MKNTREIAEEYRLSHWAGIMADRVASGLSIKAYCKREGMHQNRYHYWQRKLREASVSELMPVKVESQMPVPSGWAQAIKIEETAVPEKSEVTIEIGKCRISANESTDTELLTKICKVLVSLC
jgi:putative transposase